MNEDITRSVIKALEQNHRNGPITARNLANIYKGVIEKNSSLPADQIASLINELDTKSDNEDEEKDDENA
jgi:hypothetical protein